MEQKLITFVVQVYNELDNYQDMISPEVSFPDEVYFLKL